MFRIDRGARSFSRRPRTKARTCRGRTVNTINDLGQTTLVTYPDSTTESFTYDNEGRKLTATGRDGKTTSYEYDAVGRVTKTTFPAASGQPAPFTKTQYDTSGKVTSSQDERGNPTYYEYQPGTGRRTAVVNAKSERTEYTLGASGETLAVEDAKGNVTRSVYDANGRLVMTQPPQITGEDPTSIQTFYDAAGRRFATIDQASKFTIFFYDELGRLTQTTQVFGNPMTGDPEPRFLGTQFEYDEAGNRTVQRDALARETRFEYDKLGRMTKKTYPADANDHPDTETFTYDANGNRLTKTVGGVTTTYTYDAMNRVLTETPSAGGEAITYSYAAAGGRLDKKEIKRGSDVVRGIAFTYDERGRIKTQSTPEGAGAFADTVTFGYDKAGNRVSVQAPAPYGTVTTDYDELNRPVDIHVPGVTGTVHVEYDANGNRESIAYPGGITTSYGYNEQNRLRLIEHEVGVTTIASYTYTLGPAGNRTELDELSGRHIDWQYDDLYRLTGESITDSTNGDRDQTYEYDDVGNRTSLTDSTASGPTAYEYDDADHLLSRAPDGSGSTAYAWDTAGRNTLIGTTPYVWNPWDRLTKKDDGSATTFGYSPDGIVRTKEWKTVSPSTTQKRRYVYDRTLPYAQLLQEWDNVGNTVMADYLYLDGDLIGFKDERAGSAARYWILKDGQNSVRRVVDTTGAVVASYDYDAWGSVLGQDQPAGWIFNHRAFGEIQDPNLGMTYLRARWMDPTNGRFESRDPWQGDEQDPLSLHRYTYAHLDPVLMVDPSGMDDEPVPYTWWPNSAVLGARLHSAVFGMYQAARGFTAVRSRIYGGGSGFSLWGYPDIADVDRRMVWEIKPQSQATQAATQVARYVVGLNSGNFLNIPVYGRLPPYYQLGDGWPETPTQVVTTGLDLNIYTFTVYSGGPGIILYTFVDRDPKTAMEAIAVGIGAIAGLAGFLFLIPSFGGAAAAV